MKKRVTRNGEDTFTVLPAGRKFTSTHFRCGRHQDTTVLQDDSGYYCPRCKCTPRQVIDNLGRLV